MAALFGYAGLLGAAVAETFDFELKDALYKQHEQPIAVRVADLLGRMTLAEKAAQLGYPCGGLSINTQ